jgi:hypothetical protein
MKQVLNRVLGLQPANRALAGENLYTPSLPLLTETTSSRTSITVASDDENFGMSAIQRDLRTDVSESLSSETDNSRDSSL